MTQRSAGARLEGPAREAQMQCSIWAASANQPNWSRSSLNVLSGWRPDLVIRDFARFISSEVALLYEVGGAGQPPVVISSWGLGAIHEEIARPCEGGFVGRALHLAAQR